MHKFVRALRREWQLMFSLPWKPIPRVTTHLSKGERWGVWIGMWVVALVGLLGGALAAPAILAAAGLTHSPYYSWLLVAVAVVVGIVVQSVMTGLAGMSNALKPTSRPDLTRGTLWLLRLRFYTFNILVVATGAILVARYLDWIQSEQNAITLAFVGALLVKSIIFPSIKALVTGKAVRWFWHWIHNADNNINNRV